MKISSEQLKMRQAMPLDLKIKYSEKRIRLWHKHFNGKVYISFSGGKDSTVLLHLVRNLFPKVEAVFVDTGLEFPEIRNFVKTIDNVTWLKPKLPFNKIIKKYGYPAVSKEISGRIANYKSTKSKKRKHKLLYGNEKGYFKISEKWKYLIDAPFMVSDKCCYHMKKAPIKKFERVSQKKPFIGTMASESSMRKKTYLAMGCNAFKAKRQISTPIAFWKEEDIWNYIIKYNIPYSKIYDMGYDRTGCMFCMFGVHLERSDGFNKNRFQKMKETHPMQYKYCIEKLECGKVLDFMGINYT